MENALADEFPEQAAGLRCNFIISQQLQGLECIIINYMSQMIMLTKEMWSLEAQPGLTTFNWNI